ncbi:MAG: ABC transporter ATP-binding protein [Clostridia bacterium]
MNKLYENKILDDTDEIIKIHNLNVYYGNNQVLKDINLTINRGDFLGIIGPNGGGKTTLLKSILGLVNISQGDIEVFGHKNYNKNDLSYVPQIVEFDKNFPITVGEVVLMGRIKSKIKPFFTYSKIDKEAANEALEKIGIHSLKNRKICELSGGEFQKTIIARALVNNPKLLLLDEPTSNIDVSSCKNIYNILNELHKEITIVMVSHDMLAISSNVNNIACINKQLIYHGEPKLTIDLMDKLYGCPVDLIAHGVPHRVLREHPND